MQGKHERCFRTQVLRVGKQFAQRVANRGKQQLRHERAVEHPQFIELVRDGEDQVVVRAGQEARLLRLQPALGGKTLALRTVPLVTRVVAHVLDVPLRAAIDVSAQLQRAAARQPVRRTMQIQRQFMALCVARKVLAKYGSERAFHFALTQHPASRLRPPAQQG